MKLSKFFLHLPLLFTVPWLVLLPCTSALASSIPAISSETPELKDLPSYDELLDLIDKLTEEELAEKFSPSELVRVNEFLVSIAKEGQLPDEEFSLDVDIADLRTDAALHQELSYTFVPAVYFGGSDFYLCKGKLSKAWHKVKKFCKKHKKELIVGAAVLTGVGVVACIAVAKSSHSRDRTPKTPPTPAPAINPVKIREEIKQAPILNATLNEHITNFKETIAKEGFLQPSNAPTSINLPMAEQGRVLGSLFAHEMHKDLANDISTNRVLAQELKQLNNYAMPPNNTLVHQEIDKKFSTNYAPLFAPNVKEKDFSTLSNELLGEKAFQNGFYKESIEHFQKVSEKNPSDPLPYLEKGMAHFNLKEYDQSIKDYHDFSTHTQTSSFSIPDFSIGFAKEIPKGIYDSGSDLFLIISEVITHPINTAGQMWDALTTLSKLAKSNEWGQISEALVPEIHELVKNWDTLSSRKKGELAGYAFGKYGANIIIPGGLAKAAAKGLKGAQELSVIGKSLKTAEQTLCLETVAGIGDSAKITRVVETGQKNLFLAKELGFSTKEMTELKKCGKLEKAMTESIEKLDSQFNSEILKISIKNKRHLKFIRDYFNKPPKELQKSINSLENQIAEHQDKIANPTKHIPDWNELHPERKEALINKKWPTEIKVFEEQREILQSILKERGIQ